jgi:putative hydrolase of the HAD superfamily
LSSDAPSLQQLVQTYREHVPVISLNPGYRDLLHDLSHCYRLGIITDGLPSVQERKVKALGIDKAVNRIIYTWEFGRDKEKPHPFSFARMLESLETDPDEALYIGDNPDKDCRGAHNAGIKFIQVQNAIVGAGNCECSGAEAPEFMIETLFQLPQLLRQMPGCEPK